ncbi:hypothetical protein [Acidovorax sp. SUPP3334]|uniref:hypothetical protein n=1 Tax=Acidovorax sp. SUPP3334 TaxID=2920881 RepID=UPI0023DE4246|nr:hypothetical protein [Acidovorax sp. SUPP3334]GKT26823.1 hypothetical protein AVHM3334_22115 [Acidovorax sp. SUPP3334]
MFSVYRVVDGAAQSTEPLGTKYKFWFEHPDLGSTLFKEGRPNTGENWAEVIAAGLATHLQLPHASYQLATYEGRNGVITPSLVARGARVVHGNEVLAAVVTGYLVEQPQRYRNPNHTLRRVLAYLRASADNVGAPYGAPKSPGVRTALDFFIGYLMFDAWIGNQDRHDQNWGILRMNDGNLFLSPSFDHGSSMARNEPDAKRKIRMTTKDMPFHISSFVCLARSGLFPSGGAEDESAIPLSTVEAFQHASQQSPVAAAEWRDRLACVRDADVQTIIDMVPSDWMTSIAREFTFELLRLNKARIISASNL